MKVRVYFNFFATIFIFHNSVSEERIGTTKQLIMISTNHPTVPKLLSKLLIIHLKTEEVVKMSELSHTIMFYKGFEKTTEINCTINNSTHRYVKIFDPVYDTDVETALPYSYKLTTQNVTDIQISNNKYATANIDSEKYLRIVISKIDEKNEISKYSEFYHNFELSLNCKDDSVVNMQISVPLIDSNNHAPFFDKPKYTYNLISTYVEDFNRLLFLNPIAATDYDVTNGAVNFTIDNNKYFDIIYKGVVPGTLNKKHYAELMQKIPGALISEKIETTITVTDVGNPPKTSTSKLVVNPPSPAKPVFTEPFYIGHYYKNSTFKMDHNPRLQEGTGNYETYVTMDNNNGFGVTLINEEIIVKSFYGHLFNIGFYERNYLVYELKATYKDKRTKLSSTGSTTIIVELHHDL